MVEGLGESNVCRCVKLHDKIKMKIWLHMVGNDDEKERFKEPLLIL